jgi:hypothetical protein
MKYGLNLRCMKNVLPEELVRRLDTESRPDWECWWPLLKLGGPGDDALLAIVKDITPGMGPSVRSMALLKCIILWL